MSGNEKYFVLDTNILMESPNALFGFADNHVVLSPTTLQELDKHKRDIGERGYNSREAIRLIDALVEANTASTRFPLENGGTLEIWTEHVENTLPADYFDTPDNRILNLAKHLSQTVKNKVALVTNDVSLRVNAAVCGVEAQAYQNAHLQEDHEYEGRKVIELTDDTIIKDIRNGKPVKTDGLDCEENQYLTLRCGSNAVLAKAKSGFLEKIDDTLSPMGISARNSAQRFALDALLAPAEEIPLVILKGPAGCAKTFLSLAAGLDGAYDSKKNALYDKVMITRTNVLSDNDMGFLPGELEDKMAPLIAPFTDNLEVLLRGKYGKEEDSSQIRMQMDDLFETGVLEICSMAYMRGRSLTNAYIIVDEAQNATRGQILEICTRIGMGSKLVLCGDPNQIDNPKLDRRNNGLVFASERMRGSSLCAQVSFFNEETVRSALATEAAARLVL